MRHMHTYSCCAYSSKARASLACQAMMSLCLVPRHMNPVANPVAMLNPVANPVAMLTCVRFAADTCCRDCCFTVLAR
jgi:CelD/BcsL family acetyltransferase involved in cellulose biosynthesis